LYCVATVLHFHFVDISENLRQISTEKFTRNLAKNYKLRQNTANPNISCIFGSAGFILFKFCWEVYNTNQQFDHMTVMA